MYIYYTFKAHTYNVYKYIYICISRTNVPREDRLRRAAMTPLEAWKSCSYRAGTSLKSTPGMLSAGGEKKVGKATENMGKGRELG